jgi:hypothetical protein
MFLNIALLVLFGSGMWLIAVGLLMAARPSQCLHILSLTASSHHVNLTEQGLRMVAGIALAVRAPASKFPELFTIGGWFVIATSLVLMVVPLQWHAGYALWWAKRIPHMAVRLLCPFSITAGLALIYWAI